MARQFDIATAAEDFAGEGRSIEIVNETTDTALVRRQMKLTVNGWTFSAVWGSGTYCTAARQHRDPLGNPPAASPDAEIAVWKGDGKRIQLDNDTVAGWVSTTSFVAAVEAAEADDETAIRAALVNLSELGSDQ